MTITKLLSAARQLSAVRLTSPSTNYRLFDPMPLPRKSAAVRRERIAGMKNTA